ncbi:MFS transporter [Halococcus salsus]|uniref:MFS transporter n=1 Tax=Halococcus salsus TaxID=2162894 RepID=UPI001359059B|nr:MFS transporter [Halococcus salsus]
MQTSPNSIERRLATTGGGLRGDGRGWTLIVVAAGWFLILGGRYLFPEILPHIRAYFAVSNATAGLAITVVWAAYALMQFPAGAAADHLGERTLLVTCLVVSAGAVVAVSLAPTFGLFVVGCALFGLGTGLYGPARGMVLSDVFGDRDGTAIGATLAAGSVGSAAIPLVANTLVGPLSWQTTVALLAVPFLLVAVGIYRAVPQRTPTDPPPRPSVRGVVRSLSTAVSRRSATAVVAATLLLFVMQGLSSFLPTYLISVKELSGGAAAGLFALFFLSGALTQSIAGNAADRLGDRTVLLALASFGVVPLAVLPFVEGLVPLAVVTILLGTRLGLDPVSNAYIIAVMPPAVRGMAWGFFRTLFFFLAATGSTVVGVFFDYGLRDEVFFVLAGITALGAACYVYLPARDAV